MDKPISNITSIYHLPASEKHPLHPSIGEIYYNTSDNVSYVWTSYGWIMIDTLEDMNIIKNEILKNKLNELIDGKEEETT